MLRTILSASLIALTVSVSAHAASAEDQSRGKINPSIVKAALALDWPMYDRDASGTLSAAEFTRWRAILFAHTAAQRAELNAEGPSVFVKADKNGNGSICHDEFMIHITNDRNPSHRSVW